MRRALLAAASALCAVALIELQAGLRFIVPAAGLALAAVAVVAAARAIRSAVRIARRPPISRARAVRIAQPARAVHPAAPRGPEMCAAGCGRPAALLFEGEPACRPCADRLAGPPVPLPPADDNRPAGPDPEFDEFAAAHRHDDQESQP